MPGEGVNPFLAQFMPLLNPLALLDSKFWSRAMDPFVYGLDLLPAAASVVTTGTVQINNDSDFLLCSIAGVFASAADVVNVTPPLFTIQVQDSGSGRTFYDRFVHVATVLELAVTNADIQRQQWFPKLISGGSTLTVALANLSAVATNIRLAFKGIKIFPFARS